MLRPQMYYNKKTLPQDAQKDRPARPQASRNRKCTLWSKLRISMSRERTLVKGASRRARAGRVGTETFSAAC